MPGPPLKCEQMDEAAVELQRGAADRVGVDAEFVPEADGGEAVARGGERRSQEAALVEGRAPLLFVTSEGLQGRSANELRERPGEGATRAEQVEAGKHAADAVDEPDLARRHREGTEVVFDRVGPPFEAVAQSARR